MANAKYKHTFEFKERMDTFQKVRYTMLKLDTVQKFFYQYMSLKQALSAVLLKDST